MLRKSVISVAVASLAAAGVALGLWSRRRRRLQRDQQSASSEDDTKQNALIFAASEGNLSLVATLLKQGACVNVHNEYLNTPLIMVKDAPLAVAQPLFETLVKAGADVNARNETGNSLLTYAAFAGRLDLVKLCLGAGAKLEQRNKHGMSALIYAAYNNRRDVVAFLLERGADCGACDESGKTALVWACLRGHLATVQQLLSCRAGLQSIEQLDDGGRSALAWATVMNRSELLAAVRTQLSAGETKQDSVSAASGESRFDVFAALASKPDLSGRSPLDWARELGHAPCVEALTCTK